MLASAMQCGCTWNEAIRLTYPQAAWLVYARTQSDVGEGGGVRDATQADIRKLLG